MIKERLEEIFSLIEVDQVGLVTPEAGDHPQIEDILDFLENKNKGVSFASLRLADRQKKCSLHLKEGEDTALPLHPKQAAMNCAFHAARNLPMKLFSKN